MEKVCVRVPVEHRDELLEFAKELRERATSRGQGWDQQALKRIVDKHFGGDNKKLFEAEGWDLSDPRPLMTTRAVFAKRDYGSIEEFVAKYE